MSDLPPMTDSAIPHGCRHSFSWTAAGVGSSRPPEFYVAMCGACGTYAIWRDGGWHLGQESPGSRAIGRVEELGDALSRIFVALGPGTPKCEGCAHEIGEALNIIRAVHGLPNPPPSEARP